MNRRGYFFIIDAVIASIVLFAGLFVIFGASIRAPERVQPFTALEDFTHAMQDNPISRSGNPYYAGVLLPAGLAPDPDATPFEELGYLLAINGTSFCPQSPTTLCGEHAVNLSVSLVATTLGDQYGVQIVLNGTTLMHSARSQNYVFSRSTIVYTRVNSTLIGPLPGEVQLWQ